jgi:colanic acid biosynthesis glycosyl transferase WcaI
MRILLINQFYVPDNAPTGQVLHDLAVCLVKRGHQVEVLCSRKAYGGGNSYPKIEVRDGVTIRRLPALGFGRAKFIGKLLDYASFYVSLICTLVLLLPKTDVLLCLTTPPYVGLFAALLARFFGCRQADWVMDLYPDVMAAHGMLSSDSFIYKILESLNRIQFSNASLVLSLGPHMASKLNPYLAPGKRSISKYVPLWPLADVNRASKNSAQLRKIRHWNKEKLVLLYSGNMGLGHLFEDFLEAADHLGAKGPVWAFAGEGKRKPELLSYAQSHPKARIQMLASVPKEQLTSSLLSADLLLASMIPSWQGLIVPSKIQGIFAVGRPVLFLGGTENEIAEWILKSKGGWVVKPGDSQGLLDAIQEASNKNERMRRGRAALNFAKTNFSREKNPKIISEYIEAI